MTKLNRLPWSSVIRASDSDEISCTHQPGQEKATREKLENNGTKGFKAKKVEW
jgi:hypothetical protein